MQRRRPDRVYLGPPPLLILLILLALFSAVLGIGLYTVTAASVVVNVGTQHAVAHTHQSTVRGLLAEAGVYLEHEDTITPALDSPIHSGMVVSVDKARAVLLDVDGQQRRILTHLTDPRAILLANGITPGDHDVIRTNDPNDISLLRAVPITVNDTGQTQTLISTAPDVGSALADANISLHLADTVTPDVSTPLSANLTVSIRRSVPVTFQVDGRILVTRTHGTTVDAALAEAGIALVGLDSSAPTGDQLLVPNMTIRVIRVTEAEEVERTEVPFKYITQPDPAVDLDMQRVIQAGVPGIQEIHVRVRREDGVEVSRSAPLSWVVQPPRDEIDAVGTRVTLHTLDTSDGTIHYWRVIHMRVASYKPASTGKASSDPTYGVTASGKALRKGLVAVDPTLIPLGTALYVPKYGNALAADTGGAVIGAVIDLGYSDNDYQEWSGSVDVYLLAPAPPVDQIKPLPKDQPTP